MQNVARAGAPSHEAQGLRAGVIHRAVGGVVQSLRRSMRGGAGRAAVRDVDLLQRPVDALERRIMMAGAALEFTPQSPLGARVYAANAVDRLASPGETDTFEVQLLSGQRLSARVLPGASSTLRPQITVLDNNGNIVVSPMVAPSAGKAAVVPGVALPAGTYTLEIEAADSTAGGYALSAFLNTSVEFEPGGSIANDTPATAVNLSGVTTSLQGAGRIASVSGIADGFTAAGAIRPDYYRLDLLQGEAFSALVDTVGDGGGQFGAQSELRELGGIFALGSGDFNEDGLTDVVVGGVGEDASGRLHVLLSAGDGNFTRVNWEGGSTIYDLAVGDFNQDGHLDVAALGEGFGGPDSQSRLTFFYGDGTGAASSSSDTFIDAANAIATGDVNNDGFDDLAIGAFAYFSPSGEPGEPQDEPAGSFNLLLSSGAGNGLPINRTLSVPAMRRIHDIALVDINGDGFDDVITGEGNSAGDYGRFGFYRMSADDPGEYIEADYSIDGYEQPIGRIAGGVSPATNRVSVLGLHLNTGRGAATAWTLDENGAPVSGTSWDIQPTSFSERAGLTLADVNRDGRLDALTTSGSGDNSAYLSLGGADGFFFAGGSSFEMTTRAGPVAAIDYTGDGDLDLVAGSMEYEYDGNESYSDLAVRPGLGEVRIKLIDAAGNVLLHHVNGGAFAQQAILDFIAPAAGPYYVQVSGDSGTQYALGVSGAAQFGIDPQVVDGRPQQITASRQVAGRVVNGSEVDSYKIALKAGDVINAAAIARTLGPGDAYNGLTPILRLLAPGGAIAVADENAAGAASAGIVNFTVPADGEYSITVSGRGNAGDYDLRVTGNTGALPPFTLNSADPGYPRAGDVVGFRPYIQLRFSHPVLASSVQAGDILINGEPATAVYEINGDSVTFDTSGRITTDGVYNVSIPAGAFTSSLGVPIAATNYSFTVDANGPRVVSSNVAQNQVFEPGSRTWSVGFSEPVRRYISSDFFFQFILGPEDIVTRNQSTGQNVTVSQIVATAIPDGDTGDATAFDFVYANLPEGLYEGRLLSGASSFASRSPTGQFDSQALDGEFSGALPSGDGNPGGDFAVSFAVDATGVTPLTQLTARSPVGSAVHELSVSKAFHATGDVDSFSINLDPNQQITLVLVPTGNPGVEAKLELIDPSGVSLAAASGAAGGTLLLNAVNGTTGGTYRIDATSLAGIAGYTLRVIVNAAAEDEAAGPNNNSRAAAQALNLRAIATGLAGVRAALVGDAAGSDDYFKIDLAAGHAASFALSAINGSTVAFRLEDAAGNLITRGAGGQYNADLTAVDYVAPATGTVYVVVSGNGAYNLLATRSASIEREAEVAPVPPQDLSVTKQVVGDLKGGTPVGGAIDVLHVANTNPNFQGNLDYLINQLNDDTHYNFTATRTDASGADTLDELASYDIVILAELSGSAFTPGLATALKRYVELGGAVIVVGSTSQQFSHPAMAAFAPLLPFEANGGTNFAGGNLTPSGTHPITQQITSVAFPVSTYAPNVLVSGATVVARNNGAASVVVRENIGLGGRVIHLGPDYGAQYTNTADLRAGQADRLLEQTLAYAALSGDQSDAYALSLNAGDAIVLSTLLPTGETALPVNLLDPILELYDPAGALVASNDNGPDGRNSRIAYTAGVSGTFRVVVRAKDVDGGAYTLQVTGATGSTLVVPPRVIATTPRSEPIAAAPTTIDLVLSENILASSVAASDLTIVGGSVSAAQFIDGRTVRFTVSVPDADAAYGYSVAAGAFTDLQGVASEAFAGAFTIDKRGPRVISSTPASEASSPFKLWTFTFSEELAALPSSYNYEDFFTITGPDGTAVQSFQIRSVSIVGNVFSIEFGGLTQSGNYTIALKPAKFKDLRGNLMDQDADGVGGEATQDRYTSTIALASPNLVVDSVQVLTPAVFGSPVTVRWTVRNAGTDPAAAGWQDRLYFSADDAVDGNDPILLTVGAPTVPLAAGQTYTREETVTLPLSSTVTPGSYRFVVRTDRSNTQIESNEEDNTRASAATSVTLPALPDLAVSDVTVTAPTTPAAGAQATVQWKITNNGTAAVNGVIRERISLSTDAVEGGDVSLGEVDYAVNLAPGQSVVRTQAVTVPISQHGQRHVLVKTDSNNVVFEHANEANNLGASPQITVIASPVPDLVVTSITAPAAAQSGTTQQISWVLTNNGTAAFSGTISEQIYLSADAEAGGDDFFKAVEFTGTIAAGASITRTESIDIPIAYSGPRRVVVVTDASNSVFEDVGDANNTTIDDAVMNITLPPTPDLVVASITAPATQRSGRAMPVSWTITNNGTAAMTGTFQEAVYLSADGVIGNDAAFATFTFTGTIAPGATITRSQTIDIPSVYEGTFQAVVVVDSANQVFENLGESNNAAIDDAATAITQSPYPNLQVGYVTVPPTAQSEETIDIEWAVANNGSESTNALAWSDHVYLSADANFDATDVVLATVTNASYLNAGESYLGKATVTLPRGLQGDYYIFVASDVNNQVFEYAPGVNAEGDNRTRSGAISITLSPPPDLVVTNVVAPLVAFSGELTEIAWTVANNGAGATRLAETGWTDTVYLSADNTFGPGDQLLGSFEHAGGMAAGASYNASGRVRLPTGISGEYYFLVHTDAADRVYENAFEANNVTSETGVTQVMLAPPPDLRVSSLTAPAAATAGRGLAIDYTVINEGAEPTPNSGWDDHFYLSPTPTIDSGTLIYLGARSRSGALAPGASYSATFNTAVPLNLSGDYYVFVQTDAPNAVFELDNANNIVGAATPVTITQAFADLQITAFTPPAAAEAGTAVPFSWTITNNGAGDTIVSDWLDRVVLSADNVYGNGDDVGLEFVAHSGLLAPGASYTRTQSLGIPQYVGDGTYNVFLAADASDAVVETDNANNVNAVSPGTITISRFTADLQVTAVTAPASAASGQSVPVSFVVSNLGSAITGATSWVDQIWLSQDSTIGTGDVQLAAVQRTNALPANGTYTVNTSVTLPDVTGDYYLVVRTDGGDVVIEGAQNANNDRAPANATNISLRALPDLTVSSVSAPSGAFAGQSTELSWTVTNAGANLPGDFWYDTVYLSRDTTLDRTDKALGSFRHDAPLAAGGSYTTSESVTLPPGLSGEYY
ncbi:MAG TPA: CARDB domain-containing protein, partial [Tepidisphaeraceae bacterium]